ncbi:MAG: ribosome silencing factor [Thermodesulfobacteriota bacterium]|nr:ribosome silencing factor [Thermodesulfobacteriota bacterium]
MKDLWQQIADAIEETKGTDIMVFDVGSKCSFADFIVIATGASDRQIGTMAHHIIKECGKPFSREGIDQGRWVLLDYIQVVVHIFQKDLREYYDIEGMWDSQSRLV